MDFTAIPNDLRSPGIYVEADPTRAAPGAASPPLRVLLLGQKLSTGQATANLPVRWYAATDAEDLFGRGSMLHRMVRAFVAASPGGMETWAIPLADAGAGVAATGTVELTGTITRAGTLNLWIGGRSVAVAVALTDTPTTVATALNTAINADLLLPVTSSRTTATLTLTARHKGENGNAIDLRAGYYNGETVPPGLAVAITAMASGATNPDLTSAIAAMSDTHWTDVAMPYVDAANLTRIEAELADRYGPLVSLEGHAWAAARATHGNLTTLGNSRNSPHLTILGAEASPQPPEEWAASLAATAAWHSHQDPARPLHRLTLNGILPPARADRFTFAERELLLADGIATFDVGNDDVVRTHRLITTYQTTSAGVADVAWLDAETPKTVAYVRWRLRTHLGTLWPRHKLAPDGTRVAAGTSVVTPRLAKAELIAVSRALEAEGMLADLDAWKGDIVCEIDPDEAGRLNVLYPCRLAGGLRIVAIRLQFRLT